MNYRTLITGLLVLLVSTSVIPTAFGAGTDYALTLENSVDTPSRTVTIQGETHSVSAVGRTTPGSMLSVAADAPSDTAYDVLLYNGDRQIVASKEAFGEQSLQFDMSRYTPGSYLLAIYKNGNYKDVFPVVVRGYSMTVDTPSHATAGSDITVTVTATKTEDVEDPSAVQVVLASDEETQRATATKIDSNTYQTTLSLDQFQSGNTRVYAVVQGSDDAFKDGRKQLLGVSDASTVIIDQETTQITTTTATTTEPSQPAQTTTATTSITATTTTMTTTVPSTILTTSLVSTTPSTATTTKSTSTTTTAQTQTTDASVITPAQSTVSPSPTVGQDVPGFGIVGSLVALWCLLLLASRR